MALRKAQTPHYLHQPPIIICRNLKLQTGATVYCKEMVIMLPFKKYKQQFKCLKKRETKTLQYHILNSKKKVACNM